MTTALYWITGEGEVGDTENDTSIIAADDTTEGAHPESFEDEDDAVNENVNVMLPNSSQNSTEFTTPKSSVTSAKRASSVRVDEPTKRKRIDREAHLNTVLSSATRALNDISQAASQRRENTPNQNRTQNATNFNNATLSFCQMLYHELMNLDGETRSEVQFRLYSTLMQAKSTVKTCRPTPSVAGTTKRCVPIEFGKRECVQTDCCAQLRH